MTLDLLPVRRALLSVSDKTGLLDLAHALARHGVELLSTGGTAKTLRDAGLAVRDVAEVTGFPEMMDGRVKTLHPKVHGGLLGRTGVDDAVMAEHGIGAIDLLVLNLYPFEAVTAKAGCTLADAVENIDIGGPAMLRSAAKNFARVAVATDPSQYADLVAQIDANGGALTAATRFALSVAAFNRVAQYDAAISTYLSSVTDPSGDVATATRAKFFAALRSMAGPPMSMFSTSTSSVLSGFAATRSNGYRFSTNKSMGAMPCSAITASSVPARPSRPPCTTGCSVVTRPSIMSGKPVASLTSFTASPASRKAFAVPPVESSSTPCAASARARSINPALSDTESSARRTGRRSGVIVGFDAK